MAETVLCGVIRVSDRSSRVPALRRELKKIVPFVYLSRPGGSPIAEKGDLPIIEDRFKGHDSFTNGLHSSLRTLRQPILYLTTTTGTLAESDALRVLVDRWDQCGDRLSGVFFSSRDNSLQPVPGLYASPLLPGLRKLRSKNTTLKTLLKSEPIRTVGPARSQS